MAPIDGMVSWNPLVASLKLQVSLIADAFAENKQRNMLEISVFLLGASMTIRRTMLEVLSLAYS